jgi:hypothetical protein
MTSSAQAHSQQQKLPRRQQRQSQASLAPLVEFDWKGAAVGLILMGVLAAIGPFTMLLAWLIWRWCTRSIFDGQDRWDSVRVFAWLLTPLPLLAIFAFYVMPPLALHLWTVLPLHLLGAPDLLDNMWLRWLGSLPFALALSFILEKGNPRTIRRFARIPTAKEKAQIDEARQQALQRAAAQRAQEQAELERKRAEEMQKLERAAARRAAARRRAAAALASEMNQDPQAQDSNPTSKQDVKAPTLWEQATQATPPAPAPPPEKPKPAKPDLGDGSMDALL